jgi:hypothetical protein
VARGNAAGESGRRRLVRTYRPRPAGHADASTRAQHSRLRAAILLRGDPDDAGCAAMTDYQRDHPRLKKTLPVEIRFADDDAIFASISNISRSGLQISCDPAEARTISPPGARIGPAAEPLRVVIRVPAANGEPLTITAMCTPVVSRRVSEREYRVGLRFGTFESGDFANLERFLDENLASDC